MKKNNPPIFLITTIIQILCFVFALDGLLYRYSLLRLICTIVIGICLAISVVVAVKDKINRSKQA